VKIALGRHSHQGEGAVVLATQAKDIGVHRANLSQLGRGAALEQDLQGLPKPLLRHPLPTKAVRG